VWATTKLTKVARINSGGLFLFDKRLERKDTQTSATRKLRSAWSEGMISDNHHVNLILEKQINCLSFTKRSPGEKILKTIPAILS
jgi:hypothetical protein